MPSQTIFLSLSFKQKTVNFSMDFPFLTSDPQGFPNQPIVLQAFPISELCRKSPWNLSLPSLPSPAVDSCPWSQAQFQEALHLLTSVFPSPGQLLTLYWHSLPTLSFMVVSIPTHPTWPDPKLVGGDCLKPFENPCVFASMPDTLTPTESWLSSFSKLVITKVILFPSQFLC